MPDNHEAGIVHACYYCSAMVARERVVFGADGKPYCSEQHRSIGQVLSRSAQTGKRKTAKTTATNNKRQKAKE